MPTSDAAVLIAWWVAMLKALIPEAKKSKSGSFTFARTR